MFRLLAIALVSTFALLGVMGTVSDQETTSGPAQMSLAGQPEAGWVWTDTAETGPAQAGVIAVGAPVLQSGSRYITASEARLRRQPRPDATVMTELAPGAPVTVVRDLPGGFAEVQSADGLIGYLPAAVLHPA